MAPMGLFDIQVDPWLCSPIRSAPYRIYVLSASRVRGVYAYTLLVL
jgi:hypothetical protein